MGETLPYRDLIIDEAELRDFFDKLLYPLDDYEVFYTELTASDRFLTPEERQHHQVVGISVVERRTVSSYDWDEFRSAVRRYEAHKEAYVSGGVPIPHKAFGLFINVNPSSLLEAYRVFNEQIVEILTRLLAGDERYRPDLRGADARLLIAVANSHARKRYTDIRIDVDEPELACRILGFLVKKLDEFEVSYFVVQGAVGFDVLVRRESISRNNDSVKKANDFALEVADGSKWEVAIATNELIPLPGTLQCGKPVRVLWDYRVGDCGF